MLQKICYINNCSECKYCCYDNDSPDYKGSCMYVNKNILDITKLSKWCPLEDRK